MSSKAGSSRRVQAKSIEKRQLILDAAAKALAETGYAEAKLSDIAREAGTHAGSLYYYFPSRQVLMKEVLLIAVERISGFTDWLEEDGESTSSLNHVQNFVRALVNQLVSMRQDYYLRAYLRNYDLVPDSMRRELKTQRRHLRRKLNRLLQEAQASGEIQDHIDPALGTQFIMGATSWIGLWYDPAGPKPAHNVADIFLELVLHGLVGARSA